MIKVYLHDIEKHRNETSFRPYILAINELREIGIQLVTDGSFDIALIAQGSFIDKTLSLDESSDTGANVCNAFSSGHYMLLDGQDSHSLIGTVEVLRKVHKLPLLVLKNTLLKDFSLYKNEYVNGRYYWGHGLYSIPDIDKFSNIIKLSGSNWISTLKVMFDDMYQYQKDTDVSAMFSRGSSGGYEHLLKHSDYYTAHRTQCIDKLMTLKNISFDMLNIGERVPEREYYDRMVKCRTLLAPFGYGEIAPRDLQSAAMGAVLIKPDMSHIITIPNIYIPHETYVPCAHDFTDLESAVKQSLDPGSREYYTMNLKNVYEKVCTNEKLAIYLYDLFRNTLSEIIE